MLGLQGMETNIIWRNIENRLSVPKPKRTIVKMIKDYGNPLFLAYMDLYNQIRNYVPQEIILSYSDNNLSFLSIPSADTRQTNLIKRVSASLIMNWFASFILNAIPKDSTLEKAEIWFTENDKRSLLISNYIEKSAEQHVLSLLNILANSNAILDIFPYIAELFETEDELLKHAGKKRYSKKSSGIFYTPSDVTDYVIEQLELLNKRRFIRSDTWLDPACGTGCFLTSILCKGIESKICEGGEDAIDYISSSIYGIDISDIALQSSVYILAIIALHNSIFKGSIKPFLYKIGSNFLVHDSTLISSIKEFKKSFPSLKGGPTFIVSNPPYIKRKEVSNSFNQDKSVLKQSDNFDKNIYLTFIKMMPSLLHPNSGLGSMVVPLSLSYNTQKEFGRIRKTMWNGPESWRIAHFDRTPDSLFGDDVKTRNIILFCLKGQKGKKVLECSDFIRWSSRNRPQLFNNIRYSPVTNLLENNIFPKIGNSIGFEIYKKLYLLSNQNIGLFLTQKKYENIDSKPFIRNQKTAYNWLPFEIFSKFSNKINNSISKSHSYWQADEESDLMLLFAFLNSSLIYWLWRVLGDGFHLTDTFIKNIPFHMSKFTKNEKLEFQSLGRHLSNEISNSDLKTSKINAGKLSVSTCPFKQNNLITRIDRIIYKTLSLPAGTEQYLNSYISNTIVAGRHSEIGKNPALNNWLNKDSSNENFKRN